MRWAWSCVLLGVCLFVVAPAVVVRAQSVTAPATVGVYFTPQDHPGDEVVRAFSDARRQILVVIYEFTESHIADALVDAARRGVDIWVLMDRSATRERGSQYMRVADALGGHVRLHAGLDGASGIVHNKFAVVDGRQVLTGSFNWTYSAEDRNWENLVVIDSPALAGAYVRQFHRIWQAP